MRKSFNLILFLSVVMFAAASCNDKNNDGPDNSIAKAVEGTYPIFYTIEGVEDIDPQAEFESSATVSKMSDISVVLTVFPGQQVRSNLTVMPAFSIGLPLAGQIGEVTFRNPLEDEDNLYVTNVLIGGVVYNDAKIKIEGEFNDLAGFYIDANPEHFIEFTATVYPKMEEDATETPDPIVIRARDVRLTLAIK